MLTTQQIHPLLTTLLERLHESETSELELKSAKGGLPSSLWETVSAFANTRGGWILLGAKEVDDTVTIEGLSNPKKLLDEFHAALRNPTKINYPVCGMNDATIESLGKQQIIIIRVLEAPRQQRPVYIKGNPYTGTYVRRHTGDYRCIKPEVDRMMREASDVGADSAVLPGFTIKDINKDSLANYRRRYQTLHPAEPRTSYDDIRFLESIGGYRHDRQNEVEGLTIAGLLLLGTDQAIREWRVRHLIDYQVISDENNAEQRWDDRVAWEGNLLGAFENIYPRLSSGIASAFRLQGAIRVDEGPVHIVLREALVNLLVHADYSVHEASVIKRSPSDFVFRNPGASRVSEFDLLHGDRSDPRNPELVRMFRFIGLAEEAGTGIPKIIRAWRELGLEMPQIDPGTERYEFCLSLRQAHLLSSEDRRWLRSIGSQWSEAEQLALVHAKNNEYIDNASLSRLTGMHPADVTRVLVSLRNRDYLQMTRWGRYARYELGLATISQAAASARKTKESKKPEPIPENIWSELLQKSEQVREQKPVSSDALRDKIVELCLQIPLSATELSSLVGHPRKYLLRAAILPRLMKTGALSFLYPNRPTSVYQKYVARIADETRPSIQIEPTTQPELPSETKRPEQLALDLEVPA